MKIKKTTLLLLIKISFSCTVGSGTLNLGTYNSSTGNSGTTTLYTDSSCILAAIQSPSTVTLTNGASSISGAITLLNGTYLPVISGANYSGYMAGSGIVGFGATVSIASGLSLIVGKYSGTLFTTESTYKTSSPTVSISITGNGPTCSFSSSGIGFGNINGGNQLTTLGSISTTCTSGASYSVSADGGISTNIAARTMKNGANILNYQLYIDSGYTTVFGNGSSGSLISSSGTVTSQNLSVYGKIPSGQYPVPGTYSDTLNITLSY